MKQVIGELVSANQSVSLSGRNISDCTLLAIVERFKKKGGAKACIKVDLHKAFDSVNKDFVISIMNCIGFPKRWISWIIECIASPRFSIMLTCSSTKFFSSNRRVRQGDYLSLNTFVLVMKVLSIYMNLAVAGGKIKLIKRGGNQYTSHLLFVDDMLLFSKGSIASL